MNSKDALNNNKIFELSQNEEFRFEVGESQKLMIMVEVGLAEVKGQELINKNWYTYSDIKSVLFTFTGCRIRVMDEGEKGEGNISMFVANISSFPQIFNFFHYINKKDDDVKRNNMKSILVMGKGRSTLAMTLCNYFIRTHQTVQFTELDPSKGNIFPGAISTMLVENLNENYFELNNPHCLFYGSVSINNNKDLYEIQNGGKKEITRGKAKVERAASSERGRGGKVN